MTHLPFALIEKDSYNAAFDLPYKDLVITFEIFRPDMNTTVYNYEIQVNHLTQHTGKIDYDTTRELFAMAWGGKVKKEIAAETMREKIMDYLRDTGRNNVGMLDSATMKQLADIKKITLD
jgi:hypothetical protein